MTLKLNNVAVVSMKSFNKQIGSFIEGTTRNVLEQKNSKNH